MSLNATNTADDIVAAIEVLNGGVDDAVAKQYWTAVMNAIYTRIKADIQITSVVQTAIPVATSGNATNQTGATTATGTANSSVVT